MKNFNNYHNYDKYTVMVVNHKKLNNNAYTVKI